MNQPANTPPDTGPIGIEFGHDSYFNCPVLKFGTGRQRCSIRASVAKHLLQAIQDNGIGTVEEMLRLLVEQVSLGWCKKNLPKPKPSANASVTAHLDPETLKPDSHKIDCTPPATGDDEDIGDDDLGDLGSEDEPNPGE